MWTTLTVRKTDNGFKGVILHSDHDGAYTKGAQLFNRHFKPYPKGSLLEVVVNISLTGRRVVKSINLIEKEKDTAMPVTTVGSTEITISGKEFMDSVRKPAEPFTIHDITLTADATEMLKAAETVFTPKVTLYGDEGMKVTETVVEAPAKKRKAKDLVTGYYISDDARLVFNTAKKMSDNKPDKAVKVMMVGASGYGKTTLPKLVSELTGKKFLRMNCATIRDPEEWFGYREAREGSTVFVRSQFGRAIEEGNLVVVLDEFNRLEPWLHNTLFPLLDDDGCTVVHDEKFTIGPGVIVVGTINTGYKYTGTFELDEALMNRFDFTLEVGPMPHAEEVKVLTKRTGVEKEVASEVVKMANKLRQSDVICSTRTTLLVANMMVSGMTVREAYETAVVRRINQDSGGGNGLRKQAIDMINTQLGPYEPRKLEYDLFTGTFEDEVVAEVVPPLAQVDTQDKVSRIVLKRAPGKEMLRVMTIGILRELPLAEELDFKEAQRLAKLIASGEEIVLVLKERMNVTTEFLSTLRSAGLTGTVRNR